MPLKQKELLSLKVDLKLPGGSWVVYFIGEHSIKKNRSNALYVSIFLKPLRSEDSSHSILKKEIRQNLLSLLGEGCIIHEDYTIISPVDNRMNSRFSFKTTFSQMGEYESSSLLKKFYDLISNDNTGFRGRYFLYDRFIVPCHVIARYFFFCSTTIVDILFDGDFHNIIYPVKKVGSDDPLIGHVVYDNNLLNKREAQRIGIFFFERSHLGQKALLIFNRFRNIFEFKDSSKTFLAIIPFKAKVQFDGVGETFVHEGINYTMVQQITNHAFLNLSDPFSIKTLETIPLYPKDSTEKGENKEIKGFTSIITDTKDPNVKIKITTEGVESGPTENLVVNMPGFASSGISYTAPKRNDQFYKHEQENIIIIPGNSEKSTDDNRNEKERGSRKVKVSIESIMSRTNYIKESVRWACNALNLEYIFLRHSNEVYVFEIRHMNKHVYILEKRHGNTRIVGDANFSKLNDQDRFNLTFRFSTANQKLNSLLLTQLALALPSIVLHASIRHETDIENSDGLISKEISTNNVVEKAGLKIKNYLKEIFCL